MPLVAARGEQVSWLRVVLDRTGADITTATVGGVPRSTTVQGAWTHPIHKAATGGWSELRFQHHTERN